MSGGIVAAPEVLRCGWTKGDLRIELRSEFCLISYCFTCFGKCARLGDSMSTGLVDMFASSSVLSEEV